MRFATTKRGDRLVDRLLRNAIVELHRHRNADGDATQRFAHETVDVAGPDGEIGGAVCDCVNAG